MAAEYGSGPEDYSERDERQDWQTAGEDEYLTGADGHDGIVATDAEQGESDIDDDLTDIQTEAPEAQLRVAPYAQFDPWWDRGKCIHPSEVRALLTRAQQLQGLGVDYADQTVAMAQELYEECRGFTADEGQDSCVSHTGLAELTRFVTRPEHEVALRAMALEYGKARRPIQLLGEHEARAQVIDMAAQNAYFSYARASGLYEHNMRNYPGSCVQGAQLLQQRLRTVGLDTEMRQYFEAPFFFHFFVKMDIPGDEPLYADDTWQQTMPEDTDRTVLPHTLIAPVSRITEAAVQLGVPPRWQQMWEKSTPCDTGWWKYQIKALNRIMEVDGWFEAAPPVMPELARALEAARTQREDVDLRRLGLDLGSLVWRANDREL